MNKISKVLIITALLLALFTMFFYSTKNYSREAFVENNNGEEIIFTDVRGHMWGWIIETTEEYNLQKGDKVILFFDNNNTDEIVEDDILLKIKKIK